VIRAYIFLPVVEFALFSWNLRVVAEFANRILIIALFVHIDLYIQKSSAVYVVQDTRKFSVCTLQSLPSF